MKTYNEIQEQIEKLEVMIKGIEKEMFPIPIQSPIFANLSKQKEQLENDIKTLKWVLS
jgi:chaperonin cofactor prefoldin